MTMPDQFKTLEERVIDLESIYIEMPQLLNLRFATVKAGHEEIVGRMAALEKHMSMLTNDVRDLRNGMIVQFRLQNEKIDRMEADISGLKTEVAGLKTEVTKTNTTLAEILTILKK